MATRQLIILANRVIRNGRRFTLMTILILCFISRADTVLAQWSTNGTHIYADNAGNVSIGVSNPIAKLHLVGPFLIDGNAVTFRHQSSTSDQRIKIDSGSGSTTKQSILVLSDRNTGKWELVKAADNHFLIWDVASSADRFHILPNGNIGIGTTNPSARLHVAGDVTVTGNIAAKYQDIAEWVPSTRPIIAGSVVVLDTSRPNAVIPSARSYDTRVAGVVSRNPGVILGEEGPGHVKVATTGRVYVRVDATAGEIHIGDLLVTSDREGRAMRSDPVRVGGILLHRPGTVIGKALESLKDGEGEILVLLSMQ